MRNIDLLTTGFKVDHNPINQISDDPTDFLKNVAGPLEQLISAIPAMVVDIVTSIISNPGQLADILLKLPETFFNPSLFTGQGNLGIGSLGDLGSFIPGLGSGNILQIAETFIMDILSPTGLLTLLDPITGLLPTNLLGGIPAALINLLETPSLLLNGLFTNGLSGWNLGSFPFSLLSGTGIGGGNSIQTTANGTQQQAVGQLIPVVPGNLVNLSGFTQFTGLASTLVQAPIELLLGLFDSGQNLIGTQSLGALIPGGTTGNSAGFTALNAAPHTVTSGTSFVAPILNIASSALSGNVLFSGISLTKSGSLPQMVVQDLESLLSGFLGSSSILDQLIGIIPGAGSGLSGLGGLGSIFSDLTGLLGSPGGLGTGSPAIPGVSSIPLLGGLFGEGEQLLLSLIPTLGIVSTVEQSLTNPGALLSGFLPGGSILNQLIGGLGGSGFGIPGLVSILQGTSPTVVNPGALSSGPAPNLLVSPIFTSDSLAPSIDWSIDTTNSRTQDGSGSLMVKANGLEHAVRSGMTPETLTPVAAQQDITLSIYVANQGYSGVGDAPVLLQIAEYTQAGLQDFVTVDTYTPAGDMQWPGHQMTGAYTVPDGVTAIQARIYIADGALAGTFWFDDGYLGQTGQIKQSQVAGLPDAMSFIDARWHSTMDVLTSELSGIPVFGAELGDLANAISNFNPFNVVGSLGSASLVGDLGSIVGHMIDAVSQQPAGTTATGSLADLYNAMNHALHNTDGSDVTTFYDTTTTVPIPSYANYIDVVLVGKGQAGLAGTTLGFVGQGGAPGKVNEASWAGGTDYTAGSGNVTLTFNSDGSVTASITGHSLSAAQGSGPQSQQLFGGHVGVGPGPTVYNSKNYALGGNQNTAGAAGLSPGGGGGGGSGVTGFFQPGGPGGAAGAFLRFRSAAIAGQATGGDTTPPSAPTPHVVSATASTLTVNATGSVDA